MGKEKDLENIFGIRENIMNESGKKENKKEKGIFIIKEKELMVFGEMEKLFAILM